MLVVAELHLWPQPAPQPSHWLHMDMEVSDAARGFSGKVGVQQLQARRDRGATAVDAVGEGPNAQCQARMKLAPEFGRRQGAKRVRA